MIKKENLLGCLTLVLLVEAHGFCRDEAICRCNITAVSSMLPSSSLSSIFSGNQSGINNEFNSYTVNGTEVITNGGSWQPREDDLSPYFIIDMGKDYTVVKIITKGNSHYQSWVKEYRVNKKTESDASYSFYKKLRGNTDGSSERKHNVMFRTRYIKILPLTFEKNVSLRVSIHACDQVNGSWTQWETWRRCRQPCNGSIQFRHRQCEDPKPKYLGSSCPANSVDQQPCNTHPCPAADIILELLLSSAVWASDLLISPSTNALCLDLKSNLVQVYKPTSINSFSLNVQCNFFQISSVKVGVILGLTFSTTNAMYILKLQDGLHYHQKIHNMSAVLRNYTASKVPYPPQILHSSSNKWDEFVVSCSASPNHPFALGFEMFYRLETFDPDGNWTHRGTENSIGSCDSFTSCTAWHTNAFHNYTVRIIPFNGDGYGFANDPYRVTTKENVPATPTNFKVVMDSSTSVNVSWTAVPLLQMNGNSLGYEVAYKPRWYGSWQTVRIQDHWQTSLRIAGLEEYVEYEVTIRSRNSQYRSSLLKVRVWTDQDIPSSPPIHVSLNPESSTSLRLQWSHVPNADKNGIIINYKINVTQDSSSHSFLLTYNGASSQHYLVQNLLKWTSYTLMIAASTVKGTSVYSPPVISRTLQDRPDSAPANFRGNATSSTAIELSWDLLPLSLRHGILTKYHIRYSPAGNPENSNHEDINGGETLQGTISGLLYWTEYGIDIAARTHVGYGPKSAMIFIRTHEHPPTQSPRNLIAKNTSSYSLRVDWHEVAENYKHGIILGYTIKYKAHGDGAWQRRTNLGKENRSIEIDGLTNYTRYDVSVAAFNSKGDGADANVHVQTEEARPSQPPSSILSYNTSSTSLWVQWSYVPYESRRGIIVGYLLEYHDIAYNITKNLTLRNANVLSLNLTGLDEFREYRVSVAGRTKMGTGPFISTNALTDEDIPSASPIQVSGSHISSSQVRITWSQPPAEDQNGQLESIVVFYKVDIRNAPTRAVNGLRYYQSLMAMNHSKSSRKKRSLPEMYCRSYLHQHGTYRRDYRALTNGVTASKIIDYPDELNVFEGTLEIDQYRGHPIHTRRVRREAAVLPGFSNIVVNASQSSVSLGFLKAYMNYTVKMQATTKKGAGPLSQPILVQTGEDVPGAPPQNVSVAFTSSTSVAVNWLPVQSVSSNGIVYAYIVSIQRTNSSEAWTNVTIFEPNLSHDITGLLKYVTYSVKVLALTVKGSGPFSEEDTVRTDEDLPSGAPANLTAAAISSTALRIVWRPVPENGEPSCCIHGILAGYKIWHGKRYPTAADVVLTNDVTANQVSLSIFNLETYTSYTIEVAAFTVKGLGPKSRAHIWTKEARPVLAPQNESVQNETSTSLLIEWNELPFLSRKGDIRGYAVYYRITKSSHPFSVKWLDMYHFTRNYTVVYRPPIQVEYDDVIRRLSYELKGLFKFMEYTIHLTAYTKHGTGPWTFAKDARTNEDVPSEAASNVTGYFINSTAISVSWDPVRILHDPSIENPICCVHGNLTGYTIFYSRVTREKVFNTSIELSYFQNNASLMSANTTTPPNHTNAYALTKLDPNKNYSIYVAGNTRKGHGVLGDPIFVVTDEDVPTRAPSGIRARNASSTSVFVEWDEIIWEHRNGIITHYFIYYRETLKPWQEERSFNVSAMKNSTEILNLRKWTFYDIRIFGATVKGKGLVSANITIRTDSDVPTMPPLNFVAIDYTGPYSLLVKWQPIPTEHRHGNILSYKLIFYKHSEADVKSKNVKFHEKIVPGDANETYLEYLSTFCTYHIKILGMTNKGDGVASKTVKPRTCRCVKNLYTNWWRLPPYTWEAGVNGKKPTIGLTSDLSYTPSGIFGVFLRDMAIWGCQNCNGPRGHGWSVVHFDIDRNGSRSMKSSMKDCMRLADEFLDFTFPVQGKDSTHDFLGQGRFLPFIEHPSSALVTLKKLTVISKAAAVKDAIFSLWPIVFINLSFVIVSGYLIWLFDHKSNPTELPASILKGALVGMWWAYVTMTTVGYGDITPRSKIARIFSVMWILIGLVLFAILGSGLTAAINVEQQVVTRPFVLYNNKIGVVKGSFEERLSMLKNAKPIAKESLKEILEMLKREEIEAALADTFILSLYNEYFNRTAMYVQQIIQPWSFNYGIGLSGNVTKLGRVFTDFIHSNQQMLTNTFVQYIRVVEKSKATAVVPNSESDSPSMFQATSPVYKQAIVSLSVAIGVFTLIGMISMVHFFRRNARERILEKQIDFERQSNETMYASEKSFQEADVIWGNFFEAIEKRLSDLDNKHSKEREWIVLLHRFLNRCERKGSDPDVFLFRHGISIKNWEKVAEEKRFLKRFSKNLTGLKLLRRLRDAKKYVKK